MNFAVSFTTRCGRSCDQARAATSTTTHPAATALTATALAATTLTATALTAAEGGFTGHLRY